MAKSGNGGAFHVALHAMAGKSGAEAPDE